MTCYSVPGGLLLSPLAENSLELREKPKVVMEKHESPDLHDGKRELHREWTCTTLPTLNNKDRMGKEKPDEKIDKGKRKTQKSLMKSQTGKLKNPPAVNNGIKPHLPDISDDTNSIVVPSTLKTEHSVEPATFMNEISDQLKETKNGPLNGHIFDKNKDNQKEPPLDHGLLGKTKYDSDAYNSRTFTSSSHLQNAPNETTCLERDKGQAVYVKVEQCQYKGKEIGSQSNADSVDIATENVDQNSYGLNNQTTSQAAPSRRKIRFKAHKRLNDNITRKSCIEDENHPLDHRIDSAKVYPKDKKLKIEIETTSSEETENKSYGANGVEHKINSLFMDKSDPMSSACKSENKESSTALTAPATVLINEEWVCCDKCEKWRLLPYGMNPAILPKKWRCKMLNWL
jgi:hypothetical protein